jgi:hypothetical protein
VRKFFLVSILGLGLGIGATQAAEVYVQVGPPRAIVERRSPAPGPRHVWIEGYHRWDGRAYVWVPGRWELPPREHAVWVAPRWEHRSGGYVFIEGRWR